MRRAVLAALVFLVLAFAACGDSDGRDFNAVPTVTPEPTTSPPDTVTVRIRDLVIEAETAVTPEERGQGLSDRPSLAPGAGMLFFLSDLSEPRVPGFHMNDMQFPLDFVWISEAGTVVDLTENVPHPALAGETISGISPREPVLYTLEVNAGVVEEAGLKIGDAVEFEPDIAEFHPNIGRTCDEVPMRRDVAPDGNLLANAGFEAGAVAWCSLGTEAWGPPYAVSDTIAKSGDRSGLLELRSEHGGATRVYGLVQEIGPGVFPESLTANYLVEHWQQGTALQYMQIVVIVWNAENAPTNLFGANNHQIRYILAGVDQQPTQISNARYVMVSDERPAVGEWVGFERNVARDFEELWGAVPEGFDRVRVLFEVRWDDRTSGDGESSANVHYDDLYLGTRN